MSNPFVHVELHTPDLGRAKEFYGSLFGWKLVDEPMPGNAGTYTMIQTGDGTGGGMCSTTGGPPGWLAYVGVDDIVAATARARELGANIVIDCQAVGSFGRMTVFTDPAGATLAMWQPTQMKG